MGQHMAGHGLSGSAWVGLASGWAGCNTPGRNAMRGWLVELVLRMLRVGRLVCLRAASRRSGYAQTVLTTSHRPLLGMCVVPGLAFVPDSLGLLALDRGRQLLVVSHGRDCEGLDPGLQHGGLSRLRMHNACRHGCNDPIHALVIRGQDERRRVHGLCGAALHAWYITTKEQQQGACGQQGTHPPCPPSPQASMCVLQQHRARTAARCPLRPMRMRCPAPPACAACWSALTCPASSMMTTRKASLASSGRGMAPSVHTTMLVCSTSMSCTRTGREGEAAPSVHPHPQGSHRSQPIQGGQGVAQR